MQSVTLQSPAKINVTLRVGPRRDDGFHDLQSLVVPIDFCDTIHFERLETPGVRLVCDDDSIPTDETNLIVRAAEVWATETGSELALSVRLTKRIPVGAGFGGGSSNAAMTLLALNQMADDRLPLELLERHAAKVGSDVPLFLTKRPAIIRGRGELVEPVPLDVAGYVVLILPEFGCATKDVYAAFDDLDPPPSRISPAYFSGSVVSAHQLMSCAYNDLEPAAFAVEPRLAKLMQRLMAADLPTFRMSGSGSALFTLANERAEAEEVAERVAAVAEVRTQVAGLMTSAMLKRR